MGLFQFLEPVVAVTLFPRHAVRGALAVALTLTAATGAYAAKQDVKLDKLNLPDGFKIELYADDVPNARQMALGENGTLFVGSRRAGKVYAVIDRNGDQKADEVKVIAEGLKLPTGVAFKDGDLYVSAVTSILRFDDIESHLDNPPQPVVITDQFPDKHHGWKYIAFGPDGWLYVPIGAPCNICEEKDYANIQRLKIEGDEVVATETWAEGVRNTVGFTWHPETDEL
ncbi:PQQ-dependent sugar dehydrogenase [Microbulbifer agarilyticus]